MFLLIMIFNKSKKDSQDCYYVNKDPISAVTNVDDYSGSARLLAATTLRNVLGTRNLGDILSDRESIAHEMQVIWNICRIDMLIIDQLSHKILKMILAF